MAVSALCAWILARRQRVLYVEFSENSGLVSVFQLEYGTADMSDLFLQLRKNMGDVFGAVYRAAGWDGLHPSTGKCHDFV